MGIIFIHVAGGVIMEQVGYVRRIIDDKVELQVTRASGCGSCNGCAGGCETKPHYITLKNNIDAKVGDLVELKGETKSIVKYMFLIYAIPFAFFIAGIVIGDSYFKSINNPNYELLSFATGALGLFVSFIFMRLIDNRVAKKDKTTIVMTKVL